jgi:DNA polymerase-1
VNYFIIDGMNLAYRSHIANYEAKTSEDVYSGMFFGFTRTIQSLKKKYRQYKFITVWDHKPVHKYELLPTYKSGRTKLPSKIFEQVDNIKRLLSNICVDQYDKLDQEADDVIATLVEEFKGKSDTDNIIVYTNDKDMLQLVEDGKVVVFKPKVGVNPEKFYDEEAVKEKFGVKPSNLAVFRSFDGDESDSIKGVSRVRRKIISNIVNEYKDIRTIFESMGSISLTENERSKLASFKDTAELNYKIIALDRSLKDINYTPGESNIEEVEKLIDLYEITTVKPDLLTDLFSSSLNIRYSDSRPAVEIESFSLFD